MIILKGKYSRFPANCFDTAKEVTARNVNGRNILSLRAKQKNSILTNNAASDYNSEWWDITCCNSKEMIWSALREMEDGTRYTTTFKMKRIEEVTPPRPE